jgi:hypothetical protein
MSTHELTTPSHPEPTLRMATGTPPAGAPISNFWTIDTAGTTGFRFLSLWAVFAGIMDMVMYVIYPILSSGSDGSLLPQEYDELMWAINRPALYHIAITLDVLGWLTLGVFFLALTAILIRPAPIRGALIAGCAAGQLVGCAGAFVRLNGISDLATHYARVAPDQQAALLRSYADLQLIINSLFTAGGTLWAIALLLVASVLWSRAEFPRWLTGLIALPGLLNLISNIVGMVTGAQLPFLIEILGLMLLTPMEFAVAWVFWRRVRTSQTNPQPAEAAV